MANFIVRVELYGADAERYDALYEKMSALGLSKEIRDNGTTYDLPTGTYCGTFNASAEDVQSAVKSVADPLSTKAASIFVCSFNDWSAFLYRSS